MSGNKRLIVAVTGASGSLYARILFDKLVLLQEQWEEVALIFSEPGMAVWNYELDKSPLTNYPFTRYKASDLFAPPASGSAAYDAMIICPCSAGTLGRIANGTGDNLLTRAADVMLKERKKLILIFRESPLSLIHIKNMEVLTLAGAVVYPASPGLYTKPSSIEEFISPLLDRVLEQAGLSIPSAYRWNG